MNQSGTLQLVMAHLFSLALVRDIFARHVAQGSGPQASSSAAAAPPPKRDARPRPMATPTADRQGVIPARRAEASAACARRTGAHFNRVPPCARSSPGAHSAWRHRTLLVRFLPEPWPLRHRRGGLFSCARRLFGGVVERARQASPSSVASASNSSGDAVEPGPRGARVALAIGRAVDLDLERVDAAARGRPWRSTTWPPAKGALRATAKPRRRAIASAASTSHGAALVPWRSPITTLASPRGRGGIEWQSISSTSLQRCGQRRQPRVERGVIGAVDLRPAAARTRPRRSARATARRCRRAASG